MGRIVVRNTVFAVALLARYLDVDAEDALRSSCSTFTKRYNAMEAMSEERGIDLKSSDISTKLALWEEAKAGGRP